MKSPEMMSEGLMTESKLINECTKPHEEYLPYREAIRVVRENQPSKLPCTPVMWCT